MVWSDISLSDVSDKVYLCNSMITSRTYHSLHLDIVTYDSGYITYLLLPERLPEVEILKIQEFSELFQSNVVVVTGMDWESDMTPWKAPGLKDGVFAGQAARFLDKMKEDLFFNLEISLKLKNVKRYIIGVSLSGLFAVWSATRKPLFDGVASISGSFWYDGFTEWLMNQRTFKCTRFHISLGDKEKETKNKRLAAIEEETLKTVEILIEKGLDVSFEMTEGGHFSPIVPLVGRAFQSLFGTS